MARKTSASVEIALVAAWPLAPGAGMPWILLPYSSLIRRIAARVASDAFTTSKALSSASSMSCLLWAAMICARRLNTANTSPDAGLPESSGRDGGVAAVATRTGGVSRTWMPTEANLGAGAGIGVGSTCGSSTAATSGWFRGRATR